MIMLEAQKCDWIIDQMQFKEIRSICTGKVP